MPCVGNLCPSGVNPNDPSSSPELTFDSNYCVDSCAYQCVPASVLVHIQAKLQRDKHKGWYISVTSLLGCLRQLYLERTVDYFVEPPKNWWMLRGAILHHLLENPGLDSMVEDLVKEANRRIESHPNGRKKAQAIVAQAVKQLDKLTALLPKKEIPNWEAETEYEYDTGLLVSMGGRIFDRNSNDFADSISGLEIESLTPLMLRGTIDVLRPETGELYDYKTIGDKGLGIIKNGAKPDHIMQFNLYRLLVERGRPVGSTNYTPITITKITAFYMTMMQVVKTGGMLVETTPWRISEPGDHPTMVGKDLLISKTESKPKRGKSYHSTNVDDYQLINNRRYKLTYAIPSVPLLDLDECADFVRTNVPILYNGFVNNVMPPMCPPEQRQWRCSDFCPDAVRNACDSYNAVTGEVREVIVSGTDQEIPTEEI